MTVGIQIDACRWLISAASSARYAWRLSAAAVEVQTNSSFSMASWTKRYVTSVVFAVFVHLSVRTKQVCHFGGLLPALQFHLFQALKRVYHLHEIPCNLSLWKVMKEIKTW